MKKIESFLVTGRCQKIFELEKDPMRVAMKNIVKIWGIGEKQVRVVSKTHLPKVPSSNRNPGGDKTFACLGC